MIDVQVDIHVSNEVMANLNSQDHNQILKNKQSIKLAEIRLLKSQIKEANERLLRLTNPDGKITDEALEAHDISDQSTPSQTARNLEECYSGLVEHDCDAFFVHDMHGNIIDVNNAASQSSGYTKDELLCMSIFEIETITTNENLEDLCAQVDQGDNKFPLTVKGVNARKDGTTFPVEIRMSMLNDIDFNGADRKIFISVVHDCTERKITAQALNESTFSLRSFFDAIVDPAALVDLDANFTVVNKAMAVHLKANVEDLIGKPMFTSPVTKTWVSQKSHIESVAREGIPYHAVEQYNGQWFDCTYSPVFDLDGTITQIAIIARDITIDVKKDALLKKMSQAVDQSAHLVIITNTKGIIEYVNRGFVDATGYDKEEAIGQTPRIISSGETPKETYDDMWKTLLSGKEWRGDLKDRCKDGSTYWASLIITPIFDRNDHISCFVSSHSNIASLKSAEEKLRKNEAHYSLILNGVNDGIWEWDLTTGIISSSRRFVESLGYNPDEFVLTPETWASIVHPDDHRKRACRLVAYMRGQEEICSCEYRVLTKSGKYIWLLERGVALRDDRGYITRMAGSISDITKRRNAEDLLRQAQKMEAVGQMAGGIAHEFKNALVGVVGFTELAMSDVTDTENVSMCLNELKKAADSASKLTNDLLAFSRNQEIRPTVIAFDISVPLLDMKTFMKPLLGSGVDFVIITNQDPILVKADPSQISQVIVNLCMNARDAMTGGGNIVIGSKIIDVDEEKVKFGIKARHGKYAQIYISDTGSGIEESIIDNLFDPLFTTKPRGQGTGLGLSVAHDIVEKAGGFLDIESTVGIGSTFMINIPLCNNSEI